MNPKKSHQNQFNKGSAPQQNQVSQSKMSPALAKAMGGSYAKAAANNKYNNDGSMYEMKQDSRKLAQDVHGDQIPQQLMRPPSPLMS